MAAAPYAVVHGGNSRGRVAVASRLLAPGDIVLTEQAVACVATAGRPLCDDCLTPIIAANNRTVGAANHHHQCVGCRSLFGSNSSEATRGSSSPSCAVRLAAKVLFRRCSGSLGDQQASRIDRLMCHQDEHQQLDSGHEGRIRRHEEDEDDSNQVARLVARMSGLVAGASRPLVPSTCRGEAAVPADDTLLDMARKELGRVSLNAINTCDGSGATGLGLFSEAAMFNHCCGPNCQAWWKGSKLEIRCTKAVAAGEELCFGYIPIDQPSAVRRSQLRDNWFFTCLCERCVSGQWDAELTGLQCSVASCAGAVPPPWSIGARSSSCNRCGSLRPAGPGPPAREAGHGSPAGSATAASPPSGRDNARLARSRHHPRDTGQGGRGGGAKVGLGPAEEERALAGGERGWEESLARAGAAFDGGVNAYMREDPEIALVALEESLRVQEAILHPFNKDLLRTLRYASYAAIATQRWALAYSFLSRWLHPMETMFGAAEVWDVAAMRIDAGLVSDKLARIAAAAVPGRRTREESQRKTSWAQPDAAEGDGRVENAACSELAEGLRWLWISLGRDSGLPCEEAALEACAQHGICL